MINMLYLRGTGQHPICTPTHSEYKHTHTHTRAQNQRWLGCGDKIQKQIIYFTTLSNIVIRLCLTIMYIQILSYDCVLRLCIFSSNLTTSRTWTAHVCRIKTWLQNTFIFRIKKHPTRRRLGAETAHLGRRSHWARGRGDCQPTQIQKTIQKKIQKKNLRYHWAREDGETAN
jgi:hypothetical protein